MNLNDFRYLGRRAVVVGGATGMGAAAVDLLVELEAEVVVMDRAPVQRDDVQFEACDLADRASIDAAVEACGGPINALFSCAGVADGTPGIERINFIGHRHVIDRILAENLMPHGGSISMISSAAGLAWEKHLDRLKDYLDTPDFDSAVAWIAANPGTDTYMWSKEAICAYVARQAFPMLQRKIRINAILPGPTDTPLARANAETWLGFGQDYRSDTGIDASTPDEQAAVLVFLGSHAARGVNGVTLITDAGYLASGVTGSYPAATPVADFLYGRY